MTICAKFDGRKVKDCTRGDGCVCLRELKQQEKESVMQMFYAGNDKGENGIFFSIAEFAPYRALGWNATAEHNTLADAYLLELGAQELSRK